MKNFLTLESSLQLLLHYLTFTQRCFNPPSSSLCSSSVFSACCCFSRRSPSPWLSSLKRRYVCDISGHVLACLITATHLSSVFLPLAILSRRRPCSRAVYEKESNTTTTTWTSKISSTTCSKRYRNE